MQQNPPPYQYNQPAQMQQPMYAPPPQNPGYQYPPQPVHQQPYPPQQASPQVVVTNVTHHHDDRPNHLLHCIITLFCPWWILVWCCVCLCYGC